jgi:hypothetical protein
MQTFSIKGQVIDAKSRQPLVGLRIEAWDKDLVIDDLLGSAVSDQTGRFAIEFDRRYYQELIVDRRPDIYFKVYYQYQLVADTSDHVLWNAGRAVPEIVIAISGDATGGLGGGGGGRGADGGGNGAFEVRGRVTDDRRVPARGLKVEALDHDLDGTTSLGSTTTDDAGAYSIRYTPARKPRADLEVRALSVGSKVIYGAGPLETVNLVIPTTEVSRATEYEQLLTALQPQLGRTALGQLTPAGVNYLANKTGWDPRSVAMAAQAEQLASTTHIPAAHYYALFRSGAPSDAVGMSRLSTGFVTHALTSAIESKVIAATGSIEDTVAAHQAESARHLTALKPVGAVSSLGEMLDLRLDAATKSTFIAQYQVHSTDPAALWKALADARVAPGTIAALQTDGKLGYLTRFNAPLVARLRERAGIAAADDLARAGLYRPSAWIELIGNDVPAGLTREAYAAGLAAQVNLSYPTLVTAAMVGTGEVVLPGARAGGNLDAAIAGP